MDIFDLDLQLFAGEGGGASGAAGAGAGEGAGSAGEAAPEAAPAVSKRSRQNPLANVKYGLQPDGGQTAQPQQESQGVTGPDTGADPEAEWADIRNSRYKEQFDRDVRNAVMDRLKNAKAGEQQLKALEPITKALAAKYGKDPTDIDGIVAAYTDDDALYEDEAVEKGIPVSMVKSMHKLEAQVEAQRQQEQQTQEQLMFQQHMQKLTREAEEVRKVYPQFDLYKELNDPRFRRMTSPSGGVSVSDAFYALHHAELEQAQMQFAIDRTKMQMSQSIQAGQRMPAENSVQQTPSLDVRQDPSKWTKADRQEVKRRARLGEKIYL